MLALASAQPAAPCTGGHPPGLSGELRLASSPTRVCPGSSSTPSKSSDSAHDGPPSLRPPTPHGPHTAMVVLVICPRGGQGSRQCPEPTAPTETPERQLSLPDAMLPLPGPLDQRQGLPEPHYPVAQGASVNGEDHPHRAKQGVALPKSRCSRVLTGARQFTGTVVNRYQTRPVLGVWRPQAPWGLSPGVCGEPGQRRPDRISASSGRGLRVSRRNPGGLPEERWERACAAGVEG